MSFRRTARRENIGAVDPIPDPATTPVPTPSLVRRPLDKPMAAVFSQCHAQLLYDGRPYAIADNLTMCGEFVSYLGAR